MEKLDWAPVNVPLKRRRETCAVFTFITLPLTMLFLLYVALAYINGAWAIVCIYLTWWLVFDSETHKRGGRALKIWQQSFLARWAAKYFPLRVHVESLVNTSDGEEISLSEANTPPTSSPYSNDKPHIFCLHPHGIIGLSWITSLALDGLLMRERMRLNMRLLTVSANFRIPFYRDLIMAMGFIDASKSSASYVLSKGQNISIVIGGAREAMDAHPTRFDLTLLRRRGFVRQALKHGASLVPCVSYGENELFNQLPNEPGSRVRWLQQHMIKWLGFTLPFVYGRGVFQYSLGLMPHRHPLNVVWGLPMSVPKVENPTEEDIDRVLQEYVSRLQALYERYAERFCAEHGNSTTPTVRQRWWLAHKAAEPADCALPGTCGSHASPDARHRVDRAEESLMEDGDAAAAEGPAGALAECGGASPIPSGTPVVQRQARQARAEERSTQQGGVFVPPFRVVG